MHLRIAWRGEVWVMWTLGSIIGGCAGCLMALGVKRGTSRSRHKANGSLHETLVTWPTDCRSGPILSVMQMLITMLPVYRLPKPATIGISDSLQLILLTTMPLMRFILILIISKALVERLTQKVIRSIPFQVTNPNTSFMCFRMPAHFLLTRFNSLVGQAPHGTL